MHANLMDWWNAVIENSIMQYTLVHVGVEIIDAPKWLWYYLQNQENSQYINQIKRKWWKKWWVEKLLRIGCYSIQ